MSRLRSITLSVAESFKSSPHLKSIVQQALSSCRSKDQASREIMDALPSDTTPDGAKYSLTAVRQALNLL